MPTIYQSLMMSQSNTDFTKDSQSIVAKKLAILFKKACGVEVDPITQPFRQGKTTFGDGISVEFNFQYGNVSLTAMDGKLSTRFSILRKYAKELGACKIQGIKNRHFNVFVDHDLNFEKASFYSYHGFTSSSIDKNATESLYQLRFKRIIGKDDQIYNTIEYTNAFDTLNKEYIYQELKSPELHQQFFIFDPDFELLLEKFLNFSGANTLLFQSIFTEYPFYQALIESSDNMIVFLNLFQEQYTNEIETLKSRMLLIEMVLI